MRTIAISLIIALSLFSGVSRGWAAGDTVGEGVSLSLVKARALAFENNRDIKIQEQEVAAARAGITGARGGFLPKLNASAGYTRNGSVLSTAQPSNAKKDPGIFTGYKSDNQTGLELEQSLYSGGATAANFQQSQLSLKIQQEVLRGRKLDVAFEVNRLYYGLLLADETERITKNLLDQATLHYQEVKLKYEQGTASRFDLLQSKVQVSKLMPERIKAQNAVELVGAELKNLLGMKMPDAFTLTDTLVYAPVEINEGVFLQNAYGNKPEMIAAGLGVDINKWFIDSARSGDSPQVSVNAGYHYRSDDAGDMFNRRHNNWSAGIAVRLPLFDGFSTKAKVDAAKARYAQAKLEKENLGELIAVDIRKACLDLQRAQAIVDSQKDSIEEAREALRLAEVGYDNGEGTNLDVLDAQVSLSQVEKNLCEGIYDYCMARAYLERSMGRDVDQIFKKADSE